MESQPQNLNSGIIMVMTRCDALLNVTPSCYPIKRSLSS